MLLRSSISLGRLMGVDVRVHLSFALLLLAAVVYTWQTMGSPLRGFGFCAALCFAVAVREGARAIAAAYVGLRLRAVFLLPVGGVMAFASTRAEKQPGTRAVTLAGPLANLAACALLLGTAYAFEPTVHLFQPPWISAVHMVRTFIWMQAVLAVVGVLPSALPARVPGLRRKAAGEDTARGQSGAKGKTPAFALNIRPGTVLAMACVLAGMLLMNAWLMGLGGFLFLFAMVESAAAKPGLDSPEGEQIKVRDVMLTEFTLLSTSDTLLSALDRTVHSLQDVFPVVRGDRLVGSVARDTLLASLRTQGETYLQGVMTRSLQTAAPDEKLVEALRRSAAHGASEFIPVIDDGALLGILTPQSLSRSVQIVRPQAVGRSTNE